MSFIPITPEEILPGEPVMSEVMEKVRTNLDELDSRATALEGGSNTVYPPIIMRINGNYTNEPLTSTTLLTTLNFNLTVTGVFLVIETAGTGSTTEVDIQYKRGAGSWTSILTTKPSVAYGMGNLAVSTNAILNLSEVDLQAGDFLRLSLTSKQTGNPRGMLVRIDYNKT